MAPGGVAARRPHGRDGSGRPDARVGVDRCPRAGGASGDLLDGVATEGDLLDTDGVRMVAEAHADTAVWAR